MATPGARFENSAARAEVEVDLRVPGEPEPGAGVDLVEETDVAAPAPIVVVELELAVAEGGVDVVDRHLVLVAAIHGIQARPERELVGQLVGDGGQQGDAEDRRILDVVAADPVVVVIQGSAEIAGHCEPELEPGRHAVAEEPAAAEEPAVRPDRVAAVLSAECGRSARADREAGIAPEHLPRAQELRALQPRHAGGVGEHGRGVLRARIVARRGQADVGRADLVGNQAAGERRTGRKRDGAQRRDRHAAESVLVHLLSFLMLAWLRTLLLYPAWAYFFGHFASNVTLSGSGLRACLKSRRIQSPRRKPGSREPRKSWIPAFTDPASIISRSCCVWI